MLYLTCTKPVSLVQHAKAACRKSENISCLIFSCGMISVHSDYSFQTMTLEHALSVPLQKILTNFIVTT